MMTTMMTVGVRRRDVAGGPHASSKQLQVLEALAYLEPLLLALVATFLAWGLVVLVVEG
jgi:hypothetical protein